MFQNNDPSKSYQPMYSSLSRTTIVFTQQTSRFWLPFDLKLLEILTPREYLENYCRISSRRYVLYKRIFDKYRNTSAELDVQTLFDALIETYADTIDKRLITQLIHLFDLPTDAKISFAQFRGMAAYSERYFFNKLKQPNERNSQFQKDILEILDFSSLKWKLMSININPILEEILRFI